MCGGVWSVTDGATAVGATTGNVSVRDDGKKRGHKKTLHLGRPGILKPHEDTILEWFVNMRLEGKIVTYWMRPILNEEFWRIGASFWRKKSPIFWRFFLRKKNLPRPFLTRF